MTGICITFIEADGAEKAITDAPKGEWLMELAKANGIVGIIGDCGGKCSCATCHVYVDQNWIDAVGKPNEMEAMRLNMTGNLHKDNSRLCCQLKVSEALNGLRVSVVDRNS